EVRVALPDLQVGALLRLDALGEVLGRAAEALGQHAQDGRRRGALTRLDQRDVAVGKVVTGELCLRQASGQPQVADTFADVAWTRHVDSLSGSKQAAGVPT